MEYKETEKNKIVEEWRDVEGYEGLYKVSNLGAIKSLSYMKWCGKDYYKKPENMLKLHINRYGYYQTVLYKNPVRKTVLLHRVVAEAYILNFGNKPQINHKDFNKLNNCVNNLEWVTGKENSNHYQKKAIADGKTISWESNSEKTVPIQFKNIMVRRMMKVYKINIKNGKILQSYVSIRKASRETKLAISTIHRACSGKKINNQACGYKWMFASEYDSQ